MLMFSEELSCYTNVVVSSLILKMRSEDAPLENDVFHCISFGYMATFASSDVSPKYFCANVAVFQWTVAFCNKDNFSIQEKL